MRIITVTRKPCSTGSVTVNVLQHSCGGLNIDASRISTTDNLNGGAYAEQGTERHDGDDNWRYKRDGGAGAFQQPTGRWPANLVLQHNSECHVQGTPIEGQAPVWICEDTCAVQALDKSTGILKSGTVAPHHFRNNSRTPSRGGFEGGFGDTPLMGYGDAGGGSRFFKRIQP